VHQTRPEAHASLKRQGAPGRGAAGNGPFRPLTVLCLAPVPIASPRRGGRAVKDAAAGHEHLHASRHATSGWPLPSSRAHWCNVGWPEHHGQRKALPDRPCRSPLRAPALPKAGLRASSRLSTWRRLAAPATALAPKYRQRLCSGFRCRWSDRGIYQHISEIYSMRLTGDDSLVFQPFLHFML
jgi:hypothetical protein